MSYCEDYPCCGHTPSDPCDGVVVITSDMMDSYYCDDCGCNHVGDCAGDDDYDEWDDSDGLTDAQADAMTLSSAYGGDWWDM